MARFYFNNEFLKVSLIIIIILFSFPLVFAGHSTSCSSPYHIESYSCSEFSSTKDQSWCVNPCGSCGSGKYYYYYCTDGVWPGGYWGGLGWHCDGQVQGECSPGSGDTQACTGSCGGYRTRTCNSNCKWDSSWTGCSTDGQSCGSTSCSWPYYYYNGRCSDGSCSYQSSSDCSSSTPYCSGGVRYYNPSCSSSSGCYYQNSETCTYGCASDGVNCATCTPSCTNPDGTQKVCGDNGCGGSCGSCNSPLSCSSGKCECLSPYGCLDQYGTCTAHGITWQYGSIYKCLTGSWCNTCTDSNCGGSSSNCADGNTCYANDATFPKNSQYKCVNGAWKCTPNCAGKCGGIADGCGGTCPYYNGAECPFGSQCTTDKTCVSKCISYPCPDKCAGTTLKTGGKCEIDIDTGLPYCKYTDTACIPPQYNGCDENTKACKPCVPDCNFPKCQGADNGCGDICSFTQDTCQQNSDTYNKYACYNGKCINQEEYCKDINGNPLTCSDKCSDSTTLQKNGYCILDPASIKSFQPYGKCVYGSTETCKYGCDQATGKCKSCDQNKECGADSCNTCLQGYQCTQDVCCVFNQGQSCGCGGQITCKGSCSKLCKTIDEAPNAPEYCDESSASPTCRLKKDNKIACTSNLECKSNTCNGQTGNKICCSQDGCIIESASPKCLANNEVDLATHKKCSNGALSCDTGYCADAGDGCWQTGFHDFADGKWECKLNAQLNAIWRKCTASEAGLCSDEVDNDCDGKTDKGTIANPSPDEDCCTANYNTECGCDGRYDCNGVCSKECTSKQYCDKSGASPLCQPLRYNGDSCSASYQCYSNNCIFAGSGSKCCPEKACLDNGICYNNDQTWTDPAYKCSDGKWVCNTGYCEDTNGYCRPLGYYDTPNGKYECRVIDKTTGIADWFPCTTSETGSQCGDGIDNDCDGKIDKITPDEDCCDQTNKYGTACECGGTYDCDGKCSKPFICSAEETKCENNNVYKCSVDRCSYDLVESCTGGTCETPYLGKSQCKYACSDTSFACLESISACGIKCGNDYYHAPGSEPKNCASNLPSPYKKEDDYCCKCADKKEVGVSCSQNIECKSNICNVVCKADCSKAETNPDYCKACGYNYIVTSCCGNNEKENFINGGCCDSATDCYSNTCGCTDDSKPCPTDSKKLCRAKNFEDCSTPSYYTSKGNYCCTPTGWKDSALLKEICDDGDDNDCKNGADCADSSCAGKTGPNNVKCCKTANDCDDKDSCTADSCTDKNVCSYSNLGSGKSCAGFKPQGTNCGGIEGCGGDCLATCKSYTNLNSNTNVQCWDFKHCDQLLPVTKCWYSNGIKNPDGTGTGSDTVACCSSNMGNSCGCGGKINCDGTCSKPKCNAGEDCKPAESGAMECISPCSGTDYKCVIKDTDCTCPSNQYADTTLSSEKNCQATKDGTYFGNDYCCKCSDKKPLRASCNSPIECLSNKCEDKGDGKGKVCQPDCAQADIKPEFCIADCDKTPTPEDKGIAYNVGSYKGCCGNNIDIKEYLISSVFVDGTPHTECCQTTAHCAYQGKCYSDTQSFQDPKDIFTSYFCSQGTWNKFATKILIDCKLVADSNADNCKICGGIYHQSKCCGNDPNEFLKESNINPANKQCCDQITDCVNKNNECVNNGGLNGETDAKLIMRCDNSKWVNTPPSAALSVSTSPPTSPLRAVIQSPIAITISADDDIDVRDVQAYLPNTKDPSCINQWCPKFCNAPDETKQCTKTFYVSEQSAGTFTYSGNVFDTALTSAETIPKSISVEVIDCKIAGCKDPLCKNPPEGITTGREVDGVICCSQDSHCPTNYKCDLAEASPTQNTCIPKAICRDGIVTKPFEECDIEDPATKTKNSGCQVCKKDCTGYEPLPKDTICPESKCTSKKTKNICTAEGTCVNSGICDENCLAPRACNNKLAPSTGYLRLSACTNIGATYFEDFCDSECNLVDDTAQLCKSLALATCTADEICNGKKAAGTDLICTDKCIDTCSLADTNSIYCTTRCDKTSGDEEITYIQSQTQWVSAKTPKCCGNEPEEYLIKTSVGANTEYGCCAISSQCYSSSCGCTNDNTLCKGDNKKLCLVSEKKFKDCSIPDYKLTAAWCCTDGGWKFKDANLKESSFTNGCSDRADNDCDTKIDEEDKDCPITLTLTPSQITEAGRKITAVVNGKDATLNIGNGNVYLCSQGCKSDGNCLATFKDAPTNCNIGTCEFTYKPTAQITSTTTQTIYVCLGENSANAQLIITPQKIDGERCAKDEECKSGKCSKDYAQKLSEDQYFCAENANTCVHLNKGETIAKQYPLNLEAPDCKDTSARYVCKTQGAQDTIHGAWQGIICGTNAPTCSNNKIGQTVHSCSGGSCKSEFVGSDCSTKLSEGQPTIDPKFRGSVKDYTTCVPSQPQECQFTTYYDKCTSPTQLQEYLISGISYTTQPFNCETLESPPTYCLIGGILMKKEFGCNSGEGKCDDDAVLDSPIPDTNNICKNCVCTVKDACSPTETGKVCNGCQYVSASKSEALQCGDAKDNDCDGKYIDEQDPDCPIALSLNPNPAKPSSTITATIIASHIDTNIKKLLCDYRGCSGTGSCRGGKNQKGESETGEINSNCNSGSCTFSAPTEDGLYRYFVCIGNNVNANDALLEVKSTAIHQPPKSCDEQCKAEHAGASGGGTCTQEKPDDACSGNNLNDYDLHTTKWSDCLQTCYCYHANTCPTGKCTVSQEGDDVCGEKPLKVAGEICNSNSECQSNFCRQDYSGISYCAKDSTNCVHKLLSQVLATQHETGTSPPDCPLLDSSWICEKGAWKLSDCSKLNNWQCNGNVREYRQYSCSAGTCASTVKEREDCTTKVSDGPQNYDHLKKDTVIDYTTCTPQACQSTTYTDSCLTNPLTNKITNVLEYKIVQAGYTSDTFNCENLGKTYCKDGNLFKQEYACALGTCYYKGDLSLGADSSCKTCECNTQSACSPTQTRKKCDGCNYDTAPATETTGGNCGNSKDDDCDGFTDEEDSPDCPITLSLTPNPATPSSTITAEIKANDGSQNRDDSSVFICDSAGCSTAGACNGVTIQSNCNLFSCTFTAPSNIGDYKYYTCIGSNSANNILKVAVASLPIPQLPSCNEQCKTGHAGSSGGTCASEVPFDKCATTSTKYDYDSHKEAGTSCNTQCFCYHESACVGCKDNPNGDATCATAVSLLSNGAICNADSECESKKCMPDYTVNKYCAGFDATTQTTNCVHSTTGNAPATQYSSGSFAPDCSTDLSSKLKCGNGIWSTFSCGTDGWECNENIRQKRDYFCTVSSGNAECKHTVIKDSTPGAISPEDCTTKLSEGPTSYDYSKKQAVTDYTTCSVQGCQSTLFTDTCTSPTMLKEYIVVQSGISSQPFDCETLETPSTYCDGTTLKKKEVGCNNGICDDAFVDDTVVKENEQSCKTCECSLPEGCIQAQGAAIAINSITGNVVICAPDVACGPTGKVCDGCNYVQAPTSESGKCSDDIDNDCDGKGYDESDPDCGIALSLTPNPANPSVTITAEIKANDNTLNPGGNSPRVCNEACTSPTAVCTNCDGTCTFTAPSTVNDYRYYACIGLNTANTILKVVPLNLAPAAVIQLGAPRIVAGDTIKISVTGKDDQGVTEIYYKKGTSLADTYTCASQTATCSYTWETKELLKGTYTYTGFAKDTIYLESSSKQVTASATLDVITCDDCLDELCWGRLNAKNLKCCGSTKTDSALRQQSANSYCTADEKCDLVGERNKNACIDSKTGFNPTCCLSYSQCISKLKDQKSCPANPDASCGCSSDTPTSACVCPSSQSRPDCPCSQNDKCDCINGIDCPCPEHNIFVFSKCAGAIRKLNGEPCLSNSECISLYCVNGKCQSYP